MPKKHYALAIAAFLAIPVVAMLAGMLSGFVDPEIAARHPNYARNYRLLESLRTLSLLAVPIIGTGLWILTCILVLKSKRQSYGWLALGVLGPWGAPWLIGLSDNEPAVEDHYQAFLGKLGFPIRLLLEAVLFVGIWSLAFGSVILQDIVSVAVQAATTGMSADRIEQQRNASSGMQSFGEGLEIMYLVILFYLLWPPLFNRASRMLGRGLSRETPQTR